ncbi:hypothetical protein VA7868_00510 [Vibrio aerogenes CECT 7868]|uniref:Lipoprotein n=1 Tax=Vibrio aerogenes CECT 7868 TaxID=1216006 RepID=A0A1M5VUF6_9VIBR|nr:hypothetical protein [Vibrio aerogenes]SHH78861.1 hypothetical protein VA7868_00510 [Vibrio aerogenes CECT 7868]
MKLKTIVLATCATFIVSGCAKNINEIQTTASMETIQVAKDKLKENKYIEVTDNGVIAYTLTTHGGGLRWKRVHIKEISYRVACEDFKWFTDRGMVVRMTFLGNGGMQNDYDIHRCKTEVPTTLYAPHN